MSNHVHKSQVVSSVLVLGQNPSGQADETAWCYGGNCCWWWLLDEVEAEPGQDSLKSVVSVLQGKLQERKHVGEC